MGRLQKSNSNYEGGKFVGRIANPTVRNTIPHYDAQNDYAIIAIQAAVACAFRQAQERVFI